jgi:hypothetical protein
MSVLAVSFAVAASVFAASVVGMYLTKVLPAEHVSADTRDVVRLGTGMLSVLASLILGLLIATVKTSYDATAAALRTYASDLIVLDETLRDYGDQALTPRRQLRDYAGMLLHATWPKRGGRPFIVENRESGEALERVRDDIRALTPANSEQKWLADQALQITTNLLRQRWLLIEQAGPSIHPVIISILVAWVAAIFASFGFSAPRNGTVYVAFLICSMAIGSSVFLILELDSPFEGTIRISGRPVRTALSHMLPIRR